MDLLTWVFNQYLNLIGALPVWLPDRCGYWRGGRVADVRAGFNFRGYDSLA
jgi:hypothetical protein